MKQTSIKRVGALCVSLAVLVAAIVSTGLIAAANTFTPSTVTVPSNVTLTVVKDFDAGLQNMAAGNAGDNNDGSIVEHCTTTGYGSSGGSIKWTYDKSKAAWSSPSIRDSSEDFFTASGDGFFLWVKTEAAGKLRLEGQGVVPKADGSGDEWAAAYCDVEVTTGENLVYFPYSSFKEGDNPARTMKSFGYHMCLYPIEMPHAGTMYVDAFGTYKESTSSTTGTESDTPNQSTTSNQPKEHNPNYHKIIDDFEAYTDNNSLIEVWTARNAGETGEGSIVTLDTTGENSRSGNSLKIEYDIGKSAWYAPGTLKVKPDNQDFQGDGFCFWLKTEKAMSMRISYLSEDAEAVFDIKDIPAGYEGYYHVPFSDVKYFQAGIETPYEELGFEPCDFYYFTFYVYGPEVYQDCQNTVWFDDLSFYAAESFEPVTNPTSGSTDNPDVPATGAGLPLTAGAFVAVSVGIVLTASKRQNRR